MKSVSRRYRIVMLAALVAAMAVPVGVALSLTTTGASPTAVRRAPAVATAASVAVNTTVLIVPDEPGAPPLDEITDAARLFLVGTMLVGVAVAVRKTV